MKEPTVQQVRDAWKQLVKEGAIDREVVRPVIASSWERSREFGVDPFLERGVVVSGDLLAKKLKQNREFLEASRPFMQTLYDCVSGSGFIVVLVDQDGIILEICGDREVEEMSAVAGLMVGTDLSEQKMGTSAPGTALTLREPLQVVAKEHFCNLYSKWTCSAAPIFDPNNKLLGALNVSGNYKKTHSHTLGMVVAASRAIENELRLNEMYSRLREAHGYSTTIIETITEGLLSVNRNGQITQINTRAKKMLGYEEEKASISYYPSLQLVSKVFLNRYPVKDKEIINEKGERHIITVVPSREATGNITGAVVILKESSKVHRYAVDLVGASANFSFSDLIGRSEKFLAAVRLARRAAASDSIVTLQGESGTGKDLFAQAIHNSSNRKNGPFISINCGALPHELVGSELFGYEEGAFTGAKKGGRIGKFELAHGGTLFLDEIGDMPLDLQAYLLRTLEEKAITRIGGHKLIPVDVRVIVATNKNLKELVAQGAFRDDLYYRLHVLAITLPSLRERGDDLRLLAENFIEKLNKRLNRGIRGMEDDLVVLLYKHKWPGNVRELQNLLEKAMHLTDGEILTRDLFAELGPTGGKIMENGGGQLKTLAAHEKELILFTLEQCDWNIARTAKILGIARNTLYNKLKSWGELPKNLTLLKF